MKSAVAFFIQLSIVAAVVVGVLYILRIGEERASESAPSAPETEQVRPARPAQPAEPAKSADPAGESGPSTQDSEAVAKEEHARPDLS